MEEKELEADFNGLHFVFRTACRPFCVAPVVQREHGERHALNGGSRRDAGIVGVLPIGWYRGNH